MKRIDFEIADMLHKRKAAQFGAFKLKLHEKNPDAPLSPFFFNLRTKDNPKPGPLLKEDLRLIACRMDEMIVFERGLNYAHVSGIPEAGKMIADQLPWVAPCRFHGSLLNLKKVTDGDKRRIIVDPNEYYHRGVRVLLVDDLITEADTKLEAVSALRQKGCVVEDIVVLIDREAGGKEILAKEGVRLHSAFTASELFAFYYQKRWIDKKKLAECKKYLKQ